MTPYITALLLWSIALVPKAILEATYFHDRADAKKTCLALLLIVAGILTALALALFVYNR